MLGDTVGSRLTETPAAPGSTATLSRAALRRGVLVVPVGIVGGWLLGRYQSTSDIEQEATVLALYLGLALVPAFAASVHVGRIASRLGLSLLPSVATAVVTGIAWGVFGGVAMYGFGLATTLNIDGPGVATLCVATGLVSGVLGALLGVGLGRRRGGGRARTGR